MYGRILMKLVTISYYHGLYDVMTFQSHGSTIKITDNIFLKSTFPAEAQCHTD